MEKKRETKPSTGTTAGADPRRKRSSGGGWSLFFKLFSVGIALWGAVFANRFQERLTGTTLLSQREQAESELRAKMFGDLIGPIAGQPGSKALDTDRELLLAELLALNFHEHFEFKPLLQHVDERLRGESAEGRGPAASEQPRHELRSIARRVAGRQIASLLAEGGPADAPPTSHASIWPWRNEDRRPGAQVNSLRFHSPGIGGPAQTTLPDAREGVFEGDGIVIHSPDGADSLRVIAHDPDWIDQTIKLDVRVWEHGQGSDPTSGADFTLTWFDFPMTDNTLLKDGNRFAFVLSSVMPLSGGNGIVHVNLVWFPRGYFTPQERPVNQRELQGLVRKRSG